MIDNEPENEEASLGKGKSNVGEKHYCNVHRSVWFFPLLPAVQQAWEELKAGWGGSSKLGAMV